MERFIARTYTTTNGAQKNWIGKSESVPCLLLVKRYEIKELNRVEG